jgi:hypothetical protein
MKIIRGKKMVTIFVGPYVTAFQWSRAGTFAMYIDGWLRRRPRWLARWWSGIHRWTDHEL